MRTWPRLTFRVWLTLIGAFGFGVRALHTWVTQRGRPAEADGIYFYGQARTLGAGHGFIDPVIYQAFGLKVDAAHHPPLYPLVLALGSTVVGTSPMALRLFSCALGAVAVVVVGLAGRRIAGERAGLFAAGAAAVYPQMWANDGMLLSEPLYAITIGLVVLTSYRFWDDPRPREAALLGAAIGLAALTRAEGLMLLVILVVPLVVILRAVDWRQKAALAVVAIAATCFVVSPWVMYNLSRFERPVTMSYGLAGLLPQANCDETYYGDLLGYWHIDCSFILDTLTPRERQLCARDRQFCVDLYRSRYRDESEVAAVGQRIGMDYISSHRERVPVVAAARVGRIWGVYRPGQGVDLDALVEGRGYWLPRVGLVAFYEMLALGVVGLVWLRRRARPILPLLAMAAMVTLVAAIAIPVTRYRIPLEVALCLLAGVVADEVWRRLRRRRRVADG